MVSKSTFWWIPLIYFHELVSCKILKKHICKIVIEFRSMFVLLICGTNYYIRAILFLVFFLELPKHTNGIPYTNLEFASISCISSTIDLEFLYFSWIFPWCLYYSLQLGYWIWPYSFSLINLFRLADLGDKSFHCPFPECFKKLGL